MHVYTYIILHINTCMHTSVGQIQKQGKYGPPNRRTDVATLHYFNSPVIVRNLIKTMIMNMIIGQPNFVQ